MKSPSRLAIPFASALAALLVLGPVALAQDARPGTAPPKKKATRPADKKAAREINQAADLHEVGLLDAARSGAIEVEAEGTGDGRMNVSVTNNSNRPLRVVLPPGLIASGAAGQMMGGMGGMGGGMMGGMGGGMGGGMMGGMGGGMGGGMMGGGMGGMGGGMMGGGMGGGMMGGGGTMPASMGMMMLGRLIMTLVGDMSSWNFQSLMMGGMMGGMGGGMMGGGMGGMGGGMMGGGMGGGMMGGMGGMGGMMSVPPTSQPFALLQPGQSRSLATRLVSLNGPTPDGKADLPAQGEKLTLGDVGQSNSDPRLALALRRLAAEKAPTVISQLVLWNVGSGIGWDALANLSKGWANPHELSLARQFVANLGDAGPDDSGRLYVEVKGAGAQADELRKLFKDYVVLGLKTEAGVPSRPDGPSVACTVTLADGAKEAEIVVRASDGPARSWIAAGKFTAPAVTKDGKADAPGLAGAVASGVLNRLVDAKLVKGKKSKGKDTYTVRIDNYSPLILNGVALTGAAEKAGEVPKLLSGLCIAPRKSLAVPASGETVEQLGLKQGVRVIAVDLSGL